MEENSRQDMYWLSCLSPLSAADEVVKAEKKRTKTLKNENGALRREVEEGVAANVDKYQQLQVGTSGG